MNILKFEERFPDEESCITFFKAKRGHEGAVCKKCKGKDHYGLQNKNMFQCKIWEFQTSLKSGTVTKKRFWRALNWQGQTVTYYLVEFMNLPWLLTCSDRMKEERGMSC